MKLNLIGQIFGTSGYSVHTKSLFNALVELGVEVNLDVPLVQGWELLVSDAELAAIKHEYMEDADVVFIGLPQYWRIAQNRPHRKFYGFLVWEGSKLPGFFREPIEEADGVLVPSTHVYDAVCASFGESCPKRMVVVPHGVDRSLFVEQPKPERFTFLANKGWNRGELDRGGLQFLFRAFAEEFRKDEPVDLKVKLNTAYFAPGFDYRRELEALNLPKDRPDILVATDQLDMRSMPGFYQGHVFVSPSMAEAFNIPCLEAMSCGIPVITTGYGGQTDFVNEDNGWLVPFDLVPVTWDVQYEGNSWARPDIGSLRKILRDVYENRLQIEDKRQRAMLTASGCSWRHAAEVLLEALQ